MNLSETGSLYVNLVELVHMRVNGGILC